MGVNSAGQIVSLSDEMHEGIVLNAFVLGDSNCDELVDEADIGPLLLLLLCPEEYAQTYPDCPGEWAGDVNQDGLLDMQDLHALYRFVARPPPAVRRPRPTSPRSLPPGP